MNDEQRALVDSLFDQASALPAGDRHAFLAAACTDQLVVGEVESLLAFAQTGSGTLAAQVGAMSVQLSTEGVREGQRIGPYRIAREIGHGGMGAVYLASRDDEFRKTVALKVLPFGMHTESAVRRFRQERQILAELEHPNIARLVDGGATSQGLPYLAMEFIDGVPITKYVAERRLGLTGKLQLFRSLCDGVEYAHQKLIIHRDIKPGNILVTAAGVPKLLDFGIAKLMTPDTASQEMPQTGTRMMTPEYASPEQVRGESVTVASDVYALGAILFELLTGQRAHRLRNYDPLELAREVCETQVRAPSTTGAPALRGDLDNIVLKAMQKDPARRYRSVEQFSADIQRYLSGFPVLARPDTLAYRAGKFMRRHWLAVGAVAAVIVALGIGLVAALHEAHIAEARFAEGRRLAGRLFDIHDDLKNLPGTTKPRQLVVQSALEYLDRLAPTAGNDPDFAWELAKAYEKTGEAQGSPTQPSLGRSRDAIASYRKAIDIQEGLLRRGVLSGDQRDSLGATYRAVSLLYRQLHDGPNCVATAQRAVELANGRSRQTLSSAYSALANALQFAGDPARALDYSTKAIGVLRELAAGKPPDSPEMDRMAGQYLIAARAALSAVRFDQALDFARQCIEIREQRLASAANNPVNERELLLVYLTAADALGATDRPSLEDHTRALPYYRKGLALGEKMVAADEHNATARFDLAIAAGKTATQLDVTEPRESIQLYQRALEAAERLVAQGPERESIRAAYFASVAVPVANLGRIAEARDDLRQAIGIMEQEVNNGPTHARDLTDLADAWRQLAELEFAHGRTDEALRAARQAVASAERGVQMAPKDLPAAWHLSLALATLARQTEPQESAALRQRILALWTGWDKMQPGTAYIEEQLRRAE